MAEPFQPHRPGTTSARSDAARSEPRRDPSVAPGIAGFGDDPFGARAARILVECSNEPHVLIDREGRLRIANRHARRAFGLSDGSRAWDVLGPQDRERCERMLRIAARRPPRTPTHLEVDVSARSGRTHRVAWSIHPFHADDGTLVGFALAGRDVTAQRRAEDGLRRRASFRRAVLRGLLDPVIVIDDHGTIQMASDSVRTTFGYTVNELVGRNITLLMPDPYRSAHDAHLARYRSTRVSKVVGATNTFPVRRKDGERIDVELSVSKASVPGQTRTVFIGSFRDVTQKLQAQQAERSMLRALASIGESAAMLAHEIKNPVTAVNLALRAVADKLGADEEAILTDLSASLKRLERQMRQTLDFARPLVIRRSTFPVERVLHDVRRSLRPLLQRARVDVSCEVAADTQEIVTDPRLLEEVLSNLVMNALEAGPGRTGRIVLSAQASDAGEMEIRVEDDGPGIPADIRKSIFRPFVTTKPDGTGLGLPICRRIVEELGGSLDVVDPRRLGGACLVLRLPLAPPTESVP